MSLARNQSMPRSGKESIVWSPQSGPQKALIDCPIREVFYGGARGGGKTDGVLGKYGIKAERYGSGFNALFFRKELPMLDDAIERSKQIYTKLGATWQDQKKTWTFKGGGRIRFRPLERVQDAEKYQGQNISDCCIEEAGNYPDPRPIDRLHGILRSATGIPTQLIMTGNPGGPGQGWIKERFVDPYPAGMKILKRALPNGNEHQSVFIPSKLQNNEILMKKDPEYINRLYLVGSPELVRAWLDGDWSAIEGAYFDNWSHERHVIKPFGVPSGWVRFRSADWGSAKPFSVGWWAIVPDWFKTPCNKWLPRGAIIRYREWYGASGPNVGLKLTAEALGAGIAEREKRDPIIKGGVLDPAAFAQDGGPSLAERIHLGSSKRVYFRKADNKRVARSGAMGGWDMMRQRLDGEDFGAPYGHRPMIYCFDTCADSIRTIPMMQHDLSNPEDIDTTAEDHCFAAGTQVLTETGEVPIEVYNHAIHGGVWSAGKWRYARSKQTRTDAETIMLTFENGTKITCTPDHRYMDCTGEWRYAKDLINEAIACDQASLAKQSRSLPESGITSAADTFSAKVSGYTGKFGWPSTLRSRKDCMFTIRMETRPIMRQRTLRALAHFTINLIDMAQRAANAESTRYKKHERQLAVGTGLKQALSGTASTTTSTLGQRWNAGFLLSVLNAAANTVLLRLEKSRASFAQTHVKPVRCVSVEKQRRQKVYCLDVPETQAFTVAGLIVHNCADEWRYACMSRPYVKPDPEKAKEIPLIQNATINDLWAANRPEKRRI